jgi:DNA-binding response OmpR family regulator
VSFLYVTHVNKLSGTLLTDAQQTGTSSLLLDPLAIAATFVVGSASGALLTHFKQKPGRDYLRRLLKRARSLSYRPADDIECFAMKALVITHDREIIRVLSTVFREKRISIQECSFDSAVALLSADKFAAIVLDFDQISGCVNVIEHLPGANKRIVVFAIASDSISKAIASRLEANCVIERPLQLERMRELLAKSYGRMLRDSQVYFRLAIELAVSIRAANGKLLQCTTLNISQTGMAVNTPESFSVGEGIQLAFAVPNTDIFVSAEGKVIWDDKHGKAGISFECTSSSVHGSFREWLHDHFHMKLETKSLSDTHEVTYAR